MIDIYKIGNHSRISRFMNNFCPIFYFNFMKDLVIGDLHFGIKSNSTQWLNFGLKYIDKQIIPSIEEEHPDRVIFLGDLFDVRYSTNTMVGISVKEKLTEMFDRFSNIKFRILAGNHDYYSPDIQFEHLNVYEMIFGREYMDAHPNFEYYTEACGYDWDDGTLYMPWYFTESDDRFFSTIKDYQMGRRPVSLVYCHSDLQAWDTNKISILHNAPVYAGHIHFPWKSGNLYNLCAALPLTFNDVNQNRGFFIIEDGKLAKTIINTTTPQFKRYFDNQIFDLTDDDFNNVFIQFYIGQEKINKSKYIEHIKYLKLRHSNVPIRVVVVDNETIEQLDTSFEFNQNIKQYIDDNIPESLIDKYELIKERVKENKKKSSITSL